MEINQNPSSNDLLMDTCQNQKERFKNYTQSKFQSTSKERINSTSK
jgi:hypothetical protein